MLHSAYLLKSNNQRHNFFMKIKECKFAKGLITEKYLKLIEVQCNILFLSVFGVELDDINERKNAFRIWVNAYLSIKNPKNFQGPSASLRNLTTDKSFLSHSSTLLPSATFGLRSWGPLCKIGT